MDRTMMMRWRRVMAIDIGSFNLAIVMFAILPLSTINFGEFFIAVLGLFMTFGVVANATDRFRLPLEHWSYLMSGAFAFIAAFTYLSQAVGMEYNAGFTFGPFFMMLAASASAYAAHVIDGARPKWMVTDDASER